MALNKTDLAAINTRQEGARTSNTSGMKELATDVRALLAALEESTNLCAQLQYEVANRDTTIARLEAELAALA